jgi:hypothetical protein
MSYLLRLLAALAALAGIAGAASATAADLPAKAVPVKAPYVSTCTVQNCTGFYLGAHVEGEGSNADILGSGINGSIFASGAGLGLHGGYQLWNGNFFASAEVGGTWYTGTQSAVGSVIGIDQRWSVDYVAKLGYGLNGLFNGPPAPSQGPVNVIQTLNAAMISPYFIVGGRTRAHNLNGLVTGGGIEYTLGGGYNAFAEYRHVNYNVTIDGVVNVSTENSVTAGVNRKF